MKRNRSFSLAFAMVLILGPSVLSQVTRPMNQTQLAGAAIFPEKLFADWQARQRNPDLDEEAKIKSTIETFFIIKYESWVKGEIFDFGFLFDQADPQASEDYAYERGIMFYLLEGHKRGDYLLVSYEYRPNFYNLSIDGEKAKAAMRPKGSIATRKAPSIILKSVWTDYLFSLKRLDGNWVIESVSCDDEIHGAYPHGTDFVQLAASIPEREKEYEAWVREYQKTLEADPKYRERLEIMQKKSKGYEGRYESENKPPLYIELSDEGILTATRDGEFCGALLEKIAGSSDEFSFIAKDSETGRLKFVRDDRGRVAECLLTVGGTSAELIKRNQR